MPFMEEAFHNVLHLLDCDHADIRRRAASSLAKFCCAMATRAKTVGDSSTVTGGLVLIYM